MKSDIIGDFLIKKNELANSNNFDISVISEYPGVYEVIRVIEGVPLFLEEHINRFRYSARLLGYELNYTDKKIIEYINVLIEQNKIKNMNIKIVINALNKPLQNLYAFFIESHYPSNEQKMLGVPVILYNAERENPNAKSTNLSIRENINVKIKNSNAYEALLVNKNSEITEGSRSNVFFIKKDIVYTSPIKNVLPGVTRAQIIDICKNNKIELIEASINIDFLNQTDALFLTGTSPSVLPICSVDNKSFNSSNNELVKKISYYYDNKAKAYITKLDSSL